MGTERSIAPYSEFYCAGGWVGRYPLFCAFGLFALYALCEIPPVRFHVARGASLLHAARIAHYSSVLCLALPHDFIISPGVFAACALARFILISDLFHGFKFGHI